MPAKLIKSLINPDLIAYLITEREPAHYISDSSCKGGINQTSLE
jgi:hypothetical protein